MRELGIGGDGEEVKVEPCGGGRFCGVEEEEEGFVGVARTGQVV